MTSTRERLTLLDFCKNCVFAQSVLDYADQYKQVKFDWKDWVVVWRKKLI